MQILNYSEIVSVSGAVSCSCYGQNKRFGAKVDVVSIGHCYNKCCNSHGQLHFNHAFKYDGMTHECYEFLEYLESKA
ncbi:MAG: hypothetical protein KKE11_05085 [Gammaproteobacteria bacterium]|nr:hypothetical protein [Gammaproteobacteria bacterium]